MPAGQSGCASAAAAAACGWPGLHCQASRRPACITHNKGWTLHAFYFNLSRCNRVNLFKSPVPLWFHNQHASACTLLPAPATAPVQAVHMLHFRYNRMAIYKHGTTSSTAASAVQALKYKACLVSPHAHHPQGHLVGVSSCQSNRSAHRKAQPHNAVVLTQCSHALCLH